MNISGDLLANEGENAILTLVPPQSGYNFIVLAQKLRLIFWARHYVSFLCAYLAGILVLLGLLNSPLFWLTF